MSKWTEAALILVYSISLISLAAGLIFLSQFLFGIFWGEVIAFGVSILITWILIVATLNSMK